MGSVSVVIPTYNTAAEWLAEAIATAVEQEPAPLEVLVVDDGSATPVQEATHPLVRVIRQPNRGLSAARNRGIREARGDLVAFLDADDAWLPGKLAAQLAVMDDTVGLVSTGFDLLAGDGATSPGWGGNTCTYRDLLRGSGICPSTVLVRRDLFERVGGFDESLRAAEDWDMWLRLAPLTKIVHVDSALVLYRRHEAAMSNDYRRLYAASLRVLWKQRAAFPVAGVRRQSEIYAWQAFGAFRATRRPSHLAWATVLRPGYVAGQVRGQVARRVRRAAQTAGQRVRGTRV